MKGEVGTGEEGAGKGRRSEGGKAPAAPGGPPTAESADLSTEGAALLTEKLHGTGASVFGHTGENTKGRMEGSGQTSHKKQAVPGGATSPT